MVSLSLMGVRLCLPSKCDGYFPAKFSSMYRYLSSSDIDQNFFRKSDFGTVPSVRERAREPKEVPPVKPRSVRDI